MNQHNDLIDIGDSPREEVQANLIKRNLSGIIDAAIVLVLISGTLMLLPQDIRNKFNNMLFIFRALALYRLFCILVLNGTLGMKLCRIKLLNDDLTPLSVVEKILAAFFILFKGVAYYDK